MPALKKTRVWPSLYFSLSSLTMSITATNASPEEDEGVAKPVLLLVQLDDVHHSLGGGLVVLGLSHGRGTDDVVAGLELGIGELVGESSTADGNTGKHA